MATPTLANPFNAHQQFPTLRGRVLSPHSPKAQPYFRVFPTGKAEYTWRITALATNQIVSRHKSLRFALRKCSQLNDRSAKGAKHDSN